MPPSVWLPCSKRSTKFSMTISSPAMLFSTKNVKNGLASLSTLGTSISLSHSSIDPPVLLFFDENASVFRVLGSSLSSAASDPLSCSYLSSTMAATPVPPSSSSALDNQRSATGSGLDSQLGSEKIDESEDASLSGSNATRASPSKKKSHQQLQHRLSDTNSDNSSSFNSEYVIILMNFILLMT